MIETLMIPLSPLSSKSGLYVVGGTVVIAEFIAEFELIYIGVGKVIFESGIDLAHFFILCALVPTEYSWIQPEIRVRKKC